MEVLWCCVRNWISKGNQSSWIWKWRSSTGVQMELWLHSSQVLTLSKWRRLYKLQIRKGSRRVAARQEQINSSIKVKRGSSLTQSMRGLTLHLRKTRREERHLLRIGNRNCSTRAIKIKQRKLTVERWIIYMIVTFQTLQYPKILIRKRRSTAIIAS